MLKRFLTSAATAVCLTAMAPAAYAAVTVADFENVDVGAPGSPTCVANNVHAKSLNISVAYGCYYGPADPADFPTTLTSNVMGASIWDGETWDITPLAGVMTLLSLDLALGPYPVDSLMDTTTATIDFVGGGQTTVDFHVTPTFTHFDVNWSDITKVSFSQLAGGSVYLAFDNITYTSAAVPEPTTWMTLLTGLFGMGAMIRRARPALALAKARADR